jgi:putative CocE/NonD family hydrolase
MNRCSVVVDYDVEMKARDGVTLRSNIYRPADGEKVPAILLRTPYDKSSPRVDRNLVTSIRPLHAATQGFAFVIQDIRGRFASEGRSEPPSSGIEGRDGYDAVEWVAAQPWCNGRVGMIGGSYASITQWVASMERPPSLRAIVPERTGGRNAGLFGAMQLDSTVIGWLAGQALDTISKRIAAGEATPKDLETARAAFANPQDAAHHLPLDQLPFLRAAGLPPYSEQIQHFLQSMADVDAARITVPVMVTSGWYDMATGDAAEIFASLRKSGGSEATRSGSRIVIGPWQHAGLGTHLGEVFFGNHASADAGGLPEAELKFLSRWLRDDDFDIPVATYFVMGKNEWRQAEDWPPPGTQMRRLYLTSKGAANTRDGDGKLSWTASSTEEHDVFEYDPHNPVPSYGGRFYDLGGSIPGPFEQQRVENRQDVLVYTSEEVDGSLEIAGPVRLVVKIASSAIDTDFMVKLCDVDTQGRSYNIADGFLRCRWRNGVDQLAWLEPGEATEIEIDLGVVAHAFLPGHRVRLQLTSSCFPAWDRNMNTGNPLGSDAQGIVAEQKIYHGGAHVSFVELPVQPA